MNFWDFGRDLRSLETRDIDAMIDAEMPDESNEDEVLLQEALALFDYVLARKEQNENLADVDFAGRFYNIQAHYGLRAERAKVFSKRVVKVIGNQVAWNVAFASSASAWVLE